MEFDYAHDLPADWLRTITVHDNDAGLGALPFLEMEVDGASVLATNSEDVFLKYVYRHTPEARWPADFVMALQLAMALAPIGRELWRERVCHYVLISGVPASSKKKKQK